MYTKEKSSESENLWNILDPQGDAIIYELSEGEADTLLSHLNR